MGHFERVVSPVKAGGCWFSTGADRVGVEEAQVCGRALVPLELSAGS